MPEYKLDNLEKAKDYAAKRLQAERNADDKVRAIILSLALALLDLGYAEQLITNKAVFKRATFGHRKDQLLAEAERNINVVVKEYAEASERVLGDTEGTVGKYFEGLKFGGTFRSRNSIYLTHYVSDFEKLMLAGSKLRIDVDEMTEYVKKDYKNPLSGELSKRLWAERNMRMERDALDERVSREAFTALERNVRGEISLSWCFEDFDFAKRNGAKGYRVYRGSSYPCSDCQTNVGFIHDMSENVLPVHANCHCYRVFIY